MWTGEVQLESSQRGTTLATRLETHTCGMLTKNVADICYHLKNFPEDKVKYTELNFFGGGGFKAAWDWLCSEVTSEHSYGGVKWKRASKGTKKYQVYIMKREKYQETYYWCQGFSWNRERDFEEADSHWN